MHFTAKLTGNRRDVETLSPKALLTNIKPSEGLFREHCWVDLEAVEAIQPLGHHKPKDIKFTAEIIGYHKRGEIAYKLTNIVIL